MQPPMREMSISRREFLRGARPTPRGVSTPTISESCLAARGIYCHSCSNSCEEAALRVAPALGGIVRILVDAERCTGCGDCVRA